MWEAEREGGRECEEGRDGGGRRERGNESFLRTNAVTRAGLSMSPGSQEFLFNEKI